MVNECQASAERRTHSDLTPDAHEGIDGGGKDEGSDEDDGDDVGRDADDVCEDAKDASQDGRDRDGLTDGGSVGLEARRAVQLNDRPQNRDGAALLIHLGRAEAAVSDIFATRIVIGERPEIRAEHASLAVTKPVEFLDLEAGALWRPLLHLVEAIERQRVDCSRFPAVEWSSALGNERRLAIQWLAVSEIGGEVRV